MKRWIIIVCGALVCLIGLAYASLVIDFEGKPKMFQQKDIQGYFIWGDDEGVHLRAVASGEKHVFTGTVYSDGRIEDIEEKSFNDADDFSHLKEHNHTVSFQFTPSGEAVGIDFYVYRCKAMDFDFYLDGDKISSDQIFVGHEGWHPGSNKFTLNYEKNSDNNDRSDNSVIIITSPGWWWWGGPGPGWRRRFWR